MLGFVLFTEYRSRVLGLLLLHPDQRYYLREIARLTDVQVLGLQWSPDGRTIAAWTQLRSNFAARQAIQGLDAFGADVPPVAPGGSA